MYTNDTTTASTWPNTAADDSVFTARTGTVPHTNHREDNGLVTYAK